MARKDGVSVIVPVYNVEKYLEKCLDSVVCQNFDRYEVIVVDDGSKDTSGKICDEYHKKYSDIIKVFHKKNGGLASARNYGIDKAQYRYLMFLDSDDWFSDDAISSAYHKITEGYDVVSFDAYDIPDGGLTGTYHSSYIGNPTSIEDFLLHSTEPSFAWIRIYDYKLFEKVKFPDPSFWYEDIATTPILLSYCKKIAHLKKPLYYYRQRDNSITSMKKDPRTLDVRKACDRSLELCNKKYKKEIEYALYFCIQSFMTFKSEYADEFLEYVKKKFRFAHKNPYIMEKIETEELYDFTTFELIPKKIHYFWFGGNPLPESAKRCIASWKKFASDYEIIEWNESNCDVNENSYVKEAYDNKKWAFVSDYFRVKIIEEYGGIYLDTDMELFSSIDFVRTNSLVLPFETNNVCAGIIGATAHHPIVKQWYESYLDDHFVKEDGSLDTENTIVVRLTNILNQYYKLDYRCVINRLPGRVTIYPCNVFLVNVFDGENVAVHHYDASWWECHIGKQGYQYNVLEYFFLTKNGFKNKQKERTSLKKTVFTMGRDFLHKILPKSWFEKLKKMYRKIKPIQQ